jgi:MSHA biogenesis protein MshL
MNYNIFKVLQLLLLVLLSFACAIQEPRPVNPKNLEALEDPKTVIDKEKRIKSPGPPPFSEKLEPVAKGLLQETKLYSLVFDKAPLSEVISAITQETDLNLSIETEVDVATPVTVHLKKVTFKEALDMVVVNGAGYAWKIEEGNLYIKRFMEKIYHLDYLDMPGETDIEVGGDMLASGVEGAGVSGKFEVKAQRKSETTDIWTGLQSTLEGLKSPEGILRINRNAGIIYMADTPKRIATMVRFLDSMSESLHRQVFIEAKILEVQLTDEYKYGIDWSRLEADILSEWDLLPDNIGVTFNTSGAILLSKQLTQTRFNVILDFLQTQGDVSVLSNPHLSVTNGQSAVMTVGFQFPYGDVSGVDRDPETGVVTFGTTIKRAVLGLQLGITPQISSDGIVTLHIVPTITRIQREEQVELPTSTTTTQSIANPVIDLQELATTVRVREGNSVVLAGLISQIKTLDHEGLPLLSRIPLLKYLFKHMQQTQESRELVVFITPYINEVD